MSPKHWIGTLWPSFIVAGLADGVFFTLFDPSDLQPFGDNLALSRMGVYTLGFFMFWVTCAVSSLLTLFFQRTADEINRCPYRPEQRPAGCPKGTDGSGC